MAKHRKPPVRPAPRPPEPDVVVHHESGCAVCWRTDRHTHTQADHRAVLDGLRGRE